MRGQGTPAGETNADRHGAESGRVPVSTGFPLPAWLMIEHPQGLD